MQQLCCTYIQSPVGLLLVAGDADGLCLLSFPNGSRTVQARPEWQQADEPFRELRRQLDAYFAGELRQFDLPYRLSGTAFQNSVWQYLASIPYGETRSYGEIAAWLGRHGAARAVGAANGNNPLPIILPCHRVIGADGSLTGFGGGMPTKQFLLKHEGVPESALHTGAAPRLHRQSGQLELMLTLPSD